MTDRDVLITGVGLVSSLGEGVDVHWSALKEPGAARRADSTLIPPYAVHRIPEIDWNLQIPRRGDQRQMELWQRLGVYAAGLALDDAGAKVDEALCSRIDMIVAAGGGERDVEVDSTILEASLARTDHDVLLNEKLSTDLRPTLFLAQLSNLLAGNISIVHKVTGSSRTFMGEEGCGIAAIEQAHSRIASGQSDIVLVGGALDGEHPDTLLCYELGGFLHRNGWAPIGERPRADGGGVIVGTGGAFLVLESRAHADQRGRTAYAELKSVGSSQFRRDEKYAEALSSLVASQAASDTLLISGASGAQDALDAEEHAVAGVPGIASRRFGNLTGHMKEPQFPFAIALAALAVHRSEAPAPLSAAEAAFDRRVETALALTVGHNRSEGIALLVRA